MSEILTAAEARDRSIDASADNWLAFCEKEILDACASGDFSTEVDLFDTGIVSVGRIVDGLESAGYGCKRNDDNIIVISWGK